jgi:hypothetical protein
MIHMRTLQADDVLHKWQTFRVLTPSTDLYVQKNGTHRILIRSEPQTLHMRYILPCYYKSLCKRKKYNWDMKPTPTLRCHFNWCLWTSLKMILILDLWLWLIQSWPPLLNVTPKDSVRFVARSNSWFQQVFYRLVSDNREGMYFQNAVFKFFYFQTLSAGQSKIESGFNML